MQNWLVKHGPAITRNTVLKQKHVSKDMSTSEMQYEDIFSSNIVKQQQVTELYRQLLDVRNNILNSLPVDAAGPVHGD